MAHMIYVNCRLNGQSAKIPALLACGSVCNVVSLDCAVKSQANHLIDFAIHGKLHGIGTVDFVGFIKEVAVQMGTHSTFYKTSFYVVNVQNLELLLGSPFMKDHARTLDFGRDIFVCGDQKEKTPFLKAAELPPQEPAIFSVYEVTYL